MVGGCIAFQDSSEAKQGKVLQASGGMMGDVIFYPGASQRDLYFAALSQNSALTPNRVNLYQAPVNISNLDRDVTQSPSALAKKRRNGTAAYY